ncbi:L-seryl-tRNA(Sec) selenium transferase [Natroniella sulfidigena]|uniref:L-seryl-tRNA(Sec) selenium transferase n=1 Tax=Natroniella sulfidigena TaxID=723921 RepID=UPI00200AD271|nr:L-seryl-tRNA(Sec) selenium transferase [Natroniella sulfidigena]MCK8816732.1 L-seryl-tRNA(Sec) selenium transferase [Natroniella sulfidigena]
MKQEILSQIPAVNDLLAAEFGQRLVEDYSHQLVVDAIRKITAKLREEVLATAEEELEAKEFDLSSQVILKQVKDYLEKEDRLILSPAVNATGVVLHTNLGRSLLSDKAQQAVIDVADNYSTLEVDVATGERGSRYNNIKEILAELTGAEDCLVVNNNAAAVLLALSSLASGKEVIISRGQLVEIGGSFRVPDVMERSGAKLVEVGSTNKVHLRDYQEAITEETALLLKVHTSNYKILGFTKDVKPAELVGLARQNDLPVFEDLGSGIFVDLTGDGLSYEPTVQESLEAGVDVVTFSGDKLLGGPQAGIIVGKQEYIEEMKRHPLTRALRIDKFSLAALEATLKEYRDLERAKEKIPTLRMLAISPEELKQNAEELLSQLSQVVSEDFELNLRAGISQVGGGSFPLEELTTYVIELRHEQLSTEELAAKLRANYPPIFTRIANDAVVFDLRTIQQQDYQIIVEAVDKFV